MKFKKAALNTALTLAILGSSFGLTFLIARGNSTTQPAIAVADETSFSKPLANLTASENRRFILGKNLFHGTSNDSRSLESRGIGPLYNALTCGDCHGGGGTSNPQDSPSLNVNLFSPTNPGNFDSKYGLQIQTSATANYFSEAAVVRNQDGKLKLENLAFGALDKDTYTFPRIAQKIIGQGLIEAIPDYFFYGKADPFDKDNDGISGRIAYTQDSQTGERTIARFGTKATQSSVKDQTLKAAFVDIGLTNSKFGTLPCTFEIYNCTVAAELSSDQEDFLIFYTRAIAPPRSRELTKTSGAGQALFNSLGCSSCHMGSIKLEKTDLVKNDSTYIHPMSDFLLHSMGDDLADENDLADRKKDEFRTAPLWGIGLIEKVNGSLNLLHDGRANTFNEAILLHGGEAQKSRDRYARLSTKEKQAINAYLKTL